MPSFDYSADTSLDTEGNLNVESQIEQAVRMAAEGMVEDVSTLQLVANAIQHTMPPEQIAAMNRAAATAAYYEQQANIAAQSPSFSEFEIQQAVDRAESAAATQAAIVQAAAQAAQARAAAERAQEDAWIAEQQASAQAAAQARAAAQDAWIAEQQASAQAAAQAQAAAREAEISRQQEQARISFQAQAEAQRPIAIASALDEHVKQLRALGYNVIVKVL
jgi:colicin import membrane protein